MLEFSVVVAVITKPSPEKATDEKGAEMNHCGDGFKAQSLLYACEQILL